MAKATPTLEQTADRSGWSPDVIGSRWRRPAVPTCSRSALASPAPVSKIDTTDWTRELWLEAYAMARRMIRDRRTSTTATAWTWYLDHARNRFGASGWRIAQAAGRVAFDARTVGYARAGSVAELERQGLVRRTRRPRPG